MNEYATWEDVAALLRQRMEEKGVSIRGLAQAIGHDNRQVGKWLQARNEPGATNMLLILSALGLGYAEFDNQPAAVNAATTC